MYTYKLGGIFITDELYHDDLEAMTFGRKDQNELMHYGIKGQSWGKRRFQNEDGSLTMAGRNRYDVGDPLQGSTNRAMAANRAYGTGGGTSGFGGASGGGGSVMRKSAPTIQWSTPGKAPFSSEGPGQSVGRTVTNKVKAKVNDTVNSGRKAADSLFGSIGNAIKPVTDAVGKATEFVTGANANRRVADAQKAYDDASRHMLVDNMSNVIGTKGANAEHDAEDWQQLADIERARAKAYDISANNRGLFDFGGKEADRHNRDMYENEAREYAKKANDLRVQAQKEYANDYRKLEEADRNLRAAEKARDENTLGGVVGNAAKDAGNWLGNAFNDAKNWVGDRAQDVGNATSSAFNDAKNWAGNAANNVGNFVKNAPQNISDWYTGDKAGREAQRYDNVVQNFERNGERNINEGIDKISDSIDKDIDRIDIDLHGDKGDSSAHYAKSRDDLHDASNKQFWEGLNQRNIGYRQDDIARQYGQKADEAQARYDAAPRQLLNAAGNWIGDRVSDAGNAVGNVLKPGINAVGNAVRDAGNWVGDTAKNLYNDADYRLYSLGQRIAQPAIDRAYQDFLDRTAQDRETYDREFPTGDMTAARYAGARIDDDFHKYQKESNKIRQNPIGSAINNVGRSIGEGAQKVGDWASNAASDVRNWGAGALDKGRQAFESLFGRSEPAENTIPEQRIEEQRIPEQRIEEQRIPEQRIEEQRIPEAIVREGEKYAQMTPDQRQARMDSQKNKPTVNGSNNVQTWDNANINTWDNAQTFGDPDMVNTIKMLNDNGFFNRGGSSNSGNNSSMSDKPSNVSDEYWRDYTSNGGTRESYDREMNTRRNSQTNQNGNTFRQEVVGTVDTSRPYHFTYDPASGQTVVVYDDEKRR